MNVAYLACGGWIASAVAAAAELGIADLVEVEPQTIAALATSTGVEARVLERVMRVLSMLDVFAEDADGRFSNTEDSRDLLTGRPGSMRAFCQLAAGTYQRTFDDIMFTLHTGQPATMKTFGGSLYQYLESDPAAADVYDRAMEDLAQYVGPSLAKAVSFDGARMFVDIGGGRGTLVKPLLRKWPDARGIVLDRESVTARAAADLARTEPALAARLEFRTGDFFAEIPQGGDVYLLKNVIHNWSDSKAVEILTTARVAVRATAGARLLVIEPPIGGTKPLRYQRLDDLMQTVVCDPGTTGRTEDQLRALIEAAGLTVADVTSLKTGHIALDAR